MAESAALDHLKQFDTPTICNALEIVRGHRFTSGFTRRTFVAARPELPPVVGYARTAAIRCSAPHDPAERRRMQLGYYEYLDAGPRPSVAVIQDVDGQPGLGAFWGEVNTTVHWGMGCVGAVTNGSIRDLDAMQTGFQCLAGSLSPSHAWVQVVEFARPVDVFGMVVRDGDLVHADRHGAVVFREEELENLPDAIDLMARREKVILDAARAPGFGFAQMRDALAAMEHVK